MRVIGIVFSFYIIDVQNFIFFLVRIKKSQEQRHKAENKILESNSNFRIATNLRTLKLNLLKDYL